MFLWAILTSQPTGTEQAVAGEESRTLSPDAKKNHTHKRHFLRTSPGGLDSLPPVQASDGAGRGTGPAFEMQSSKPTELLFDKRLGNECRPVATGRGANSSSYRCSKGKVYMTAWPTEFKTEVRGGVRELSKSTLRRSTSRSSAPISRDRKTYSILETI